MTLSSRLDPLEWKKIVSSPMEVRVYTSRLIGQEPELVIHGGGNTSYKGQTYDALNRKVDVLYVKGSGVNLQDVCLGDFADVRMDIFPQILKHGDLESEDLIHLQRAHTLTASAPSPSLEALAHYLVPFSFVDHTHPDALITLTNVPEGQKILRELYGDSVVSIPYARPGIPLGLAMEKVLSKLSKAQWGQLKGIILQKHGLITFSDQAQTSYLNTLELANLAREYLNRKTSPVPKNYDLPDPSTSSSPCPEKRQLMASIRQQVCALAGRSLICTRVDNDFIQSFLEQPESCLAMKKGPLTPDYVIYTKVGPLFLDCEQASLEAAFENYRREYQQYFSTYAKADDVIAEDYPKVIFHRKLGLIAVGRDIREAKRVSQLALHTMRAVTWAQQLSQWDPVSEHDCFQMEYWKIEQKKRDIFSDQNLSLAGKVAVVTGGACGIGKAVATELASHGCMVVSADLKDCPNKGEGGNKDHHDFIVGQICDISDRNQLQSLAQKAVDQFGGVDILVCNAGVFPAGRSIENMEEDLWDKTLEINLTAQKNTLQTFLPYLKRGREATVILIGSKNVLAPGPGASAYSVSKAGLTQLGRVAAMELGPSGIRVNTLHPNAVFDTGIWDPQTLEKRAQAYNLSVAEYKQNNILKVTITGRDVAKLVVAVAGEAFSKTTGAQITIDGGNDRVL